MELWIKEPDDFFGKLQVLKDLGPWRKHISQDLSLLICKWEEMMWCLNEVQNTKATDPVPGTHEVFKNG